MRSGFLKRFAAALTVPIAALVLCHVSLDLLARSFETRHGYYLWRVNDANLLLDRAKFMRSGKGRLMVFGASEAGEGFDELVLERNLSPILVDQMAIDGASFDDVTLQLKYIESVYGSASMPSRVVVGLSPRFAANILTFGEEGRFGAAVDQYTEMSVEQSGTGPVLRRKSNVQAARSWINFEVNQGERYRSTVKILASDLQRWWRAGSQNIPELFRKAKFRKKVRPSMMQLEKTLNTAKHWRETHAWVASDNRESVERRIGGLIDIARANHSTLYLVNLPQLSLNKTMFPPGQYQNYLNVLRAAARDTPLLDLGDLLTDEEFVDAVHPSGPGARKISVETAHFIRDCEQRAKDSGSKMARARP